MSLLNAMLHNNIHLYNKVAIRETDILEHDMNNRDIDIVKESFTKISTDARKKATRVFYSRLFELEPNLKTQFKLDIRDQRKKTLRSLEFIIEKLHDAQTVGPIIKDLAHKGIEPKQYPHFESALLFTLSAALGNECTNQIKQSWQSVFKTLTDIMIANSNEPQ